MRVSHLIQRGLMIRGGIYVELTCVHAGSARVLSLNGVYLPVMILFRAFVFLVVTIHGVAVVSQNSMTVRDTALFRGRNTIPVYGTWSVQTGDALTLDLAFDPRFLSIDSVTAVDSVLSTTGWSVAGAGFTRAVLRVNVVVNMAVNAERNLLRCVVDVLNGPDTTSYLEILRVERNGKVDSSFALNSGRISIKNFTPIVLKESEFLGPAYPSASRTPVFKYRTIAASDVTFTMFDAGGHARIVEQLVAVPAGNHTYECGSSLYSTLCAGLYLLRMETMRGDYWTSFIVLR